MSSISVDIDNRGVCEVIFDMPHSSVNLLSTPVLEELEAHIESIKKDTQIRAVLFKSAKDGIFIAGADIGEIDSLDDESLAREKVKRGQDILTLITTIKPPTIAIIDGAALGGGFELALACDYRIATQNPKSKMGLVEVSLGVIPGFGGTHRLKELVGLSRALELIMGSKKIDADKALKMGLVDASVPSGYLEFKINSLLRELDSKQGRAKIASKRAKIPLIDKYLPAVVLMIASKRAVEKTKGHYEAPLKLIELYRASEPLSVEEALSLEVDTFCSLVVTPTCKNLISLYNTSEALKKESGTTRATKPITIEQASVVGGGVMGSGIVWLFSKLEILVRLIDRDPKQISKALKHIRSIYKTLRKRRRITDHQISTKLDHITYSTSLDAISNSNLVLEAIIESSSAKKDLYREIEARVSKECIIATNTSSLSISDLASELEHPQRFIGMHFFNPVNRMPLVEIIPGQMSSPKSVATVVELAKQSGKTPIVVGDCAGFLVNRILIPYINEAIQMFEEGEDMERIDALVEEFGMPMGPFALADEVGLDVGYKVGTLLYEAYGERMSIPKIFEDIYSLKILGKKSGSGFYLHGSKSLTPNHKVQALVKERRSFDSEEIIDRCMLIMVNEAARALDEKVVKNASYLDMAMVLGTGFAPFRGGLMRYAEDRGLENVVVTLSRLANAYGDRFVPCDALVKMSKESRSYFKES